MGISGIGAGNSAAGSSLTQKPSESGADIFLNYMKKTPAQKMEDAWLGAHGLTRQQLDSMSAADKQKIMEKMRHDIEEQLKAKALNPEKPKNATL